MSLLCAFGKHKWKYLYRVYNDSFLGLKVKRRHIRFRICTRCDKAQVYWGPPASTIADTASIGWRVLNSEENYILKNRIQDLGNHFILSGNGERVPDNSNYLCSLGFHRWKAVYEVCQYYNMVLHKTVRGNFIRFRICTRCGRSEEAQKIIGCPRDYNIWFVDLNEKEKKILKERIQDMEVLSYEV